MYQPNSHLTSPVTVCGLRHTSGHNHTMFPPVPSAVISGSYKISCVHSHVVLSVPLEVGGHSHTRASGYTF